MGLLIAAGGVISYVLNRDAAQIAIASTVAFAVASTLDAVVYALLRPRRSRLQAMNASNTAAAAADSVLFPAIAFGLPIMWLTVLALFLAKVWGGLLWSLVLAVPVRRSAA